jgi:hypothetical protein
LIGGGCGGLGFEPEVNVVDEHRRPIVAIRTKMRTGS